MTILNALQSRLPSLPEQRAISHVLGTLDDKIEQNRQMNETLEDIARAVFKSWFVDFDPVRAKADGHEPVGMSPEIADLFPEAFEDSALGLVPQGWVIGRIGDPLQVAIGGDWGKDSKFDGAVKVACLRGVDLQHLRERGRCNAPRRWVKPQSMAKRESAPCDIIIATSGAGPIARPLWICPHIKAQFEVPFLYSNFCKRLSAESSEIAVYLDRVLHEMRLSGEYSDYVTGTSVPNLDISGLLSRPCLHPPNTILSAFAAVLSPFAERLYSAESTTLAQIRDTLLPKLLSGEIRIKDAEKIVGEAT